MAGDFDLTGRAVIVTGGNGGIGLGMAKALARAGCAVSIWGRNPEKGLVRLSRLGHDVPWTKATIAPGPVRSAIQSSASGPAPTTTRSLPGVRGIRIALFATTKTVSP